MIEKMPDTLRAYIAGLLDGIGGQVSVQFRWDEELSTIVIRGNAAMVEWFTAATKQGFTLLEGGETLWSIDGADLLELLKQIRPYTVRKAGDYDQMIRWLEDKAARAPTAGIMPC